MIRIALLIVAITTLYKSGIIRLSFDETSKIKECIQHLKEINTTEEAIKFMLFMEKIPFKNNDCNNTMLKDAYNFVLNSENIANDIKEKIEIVLVERGVRLKN